MDRMPAGITLSHGKRGKRADLSDQKNTPLVMDRMPAGITLSHGQRGKRADLSDQKNTLAISAARVLLYGFALI